MADEQRTFEQVAVDHKAAWDAKEYERAAALLREAKAIVLGTADVKQMGDGALQIVPNG